MASEVFLACRWKGCTVWSVRCMSVRYEGACVSEWCRNDRGTIGHWTALGVHYKQSVLACGKRENRAYWSDWGNHVSQSWKELQTLGPNICYRLSSTFYQKVCHFGIGSVNFTDESPIRPKCLEPVQIFGYSSFSDCSSIQEPSSSHKNREFDPKHTYNCKKC